MRFSIVATTLAALATASPVFDFSEEPSNENALEARGKKHVMKISVCNNCIGGGSISCNQGHYAYWTREGNSKEGTCDDHSSPFTDSCSAGGRKIDTPFGKGKWLPVDNCHPGAPVGHIQGHIQGLAKGGGVFRLTCRKHNEQWHTFCGFDFACTEFLRCTQ